MAPADEPAPIPTPPATPGLWHAGSLLLILILAGIAHVRTLDYGMLGFDTYLQINAARIEVGDPDRVWDDVKGTFTETLTDGRIAARFYRPLQNLSMALDYGLWGLDPWGFHLQSLIVYALCVVLIYLVTRSLLGPASWWGPTLAALFYALHPLMLQVVPFPCRRSETLVVLFLLLTLWVLPQRCKGPSFRALVAGFFVLLACGAKELGALGLGLVFVHQFLYSDASTLGRRIANALGATVPAFTAFGAYIINRTIVVEGLGGYDRPQFDSYQTKLLEFLPQLTQDMFAPWAWFPGMPVATASTEIAQWMLVAGLALVLAVFGMLFALSVKGPRISNAGRVIAIGVAMLLPTLPAVGMSQQYYAWYGVIPLMAVAMVIAGLGEFFMAGLARGGAGRMGGILVGVALLPVVLSPLQSSPLLHDYSELREGSLLMEDHLQEVYALLDDESNGRAEVVELIPLAPPSQEENQNRPPMDNVPLLSQRSLRALAELKYPERNIRVSQYAKSQKWRAAPNEILLKVRHIFPAGTEASALPANLPPSKD